MLCNTLSLLNNTMRKCDVNYLVASYMRGGNELSGMVWKVCLSTLHSPLLLAARRQHHWCCSRFAGSTAHLQLILLWMCSTPAIRWHYLFYFFQSALQAALSSGLVCCGSSISLLQPECSGARLPLPVQMICSLHSRRTTNHCNQFLRQRRFPSCPSNCMSW